MSGEENMATAFGGLNSVSGTEGLSQDLSPPLGILPPFQSCSERQACFIEGRWRREQFSKISVNYLLGAQTVPDKPEDLVTEFSSGRMEKLWIPAIA